MSKFASIVIISVFGLSACTPAPQQMESREHETAVSQPEIVSETTAEVEVPAEETNIDSVAYLDYNEINYSEYEGKKAHALFFHANWCPTCIGMEKDIKANLSSFPAGTNIIEVDYDTEEALKAEHNINSQSIIVVIDEEGNTVDTLVAPNNSSLIKAIQTSLQ